MNPGKTTVVIADDQEMLRYGFQLILEGQEDIEVVGHAADGLQAVEAVKRLRPDVCLMDIRMPKIDGLEATRQIRRNPATAETKIVVVTTFDLDEYVHEALRAGATGFLLKNSGARLLIEAVRAAVKGESLISPSITVRLLQHLTKKRPSSDRATAIATLTAQELNVVTRAARGWTNNEIAADMFLSLSTIKTHLGHVQTKLGVRNRVEIAAWAWENAIVD
jgi:DNA-binding NarL/FixJ family response regulator